MKKLLLLLLLLVGAVCHAYASEQTLTLKGATATKNDNSKVVLGTSNISCTSKSYFTKIEFSKDNNNQPAAVYAVPDKGTNSSNAPSYTKEGDLRLYPNNNIEFIAVEGCTISKIVFNLKYSSKDLSKYSDPSVSTGTGVVNNDKTTYTWTATDPVTSMKLSAASKSGSQFRFDSFVVYYESDTPIVLTLGKLSVKANGEAVGETLTVDQGTAITLSADNATSFEVTAGGEPIILDGPEATWTPGICTDMPVSVVAKLEQEGEETQTSEPVAFTLTVNKVDKLTATWEVTSGTTVSGGKDVDIDLTLSEDSAPGKWHAYCKSSYAGGLSGGGQQLGSSNNSFNGGTITLIESEIPENAIIKSISFTGKSNGSYSLYVTVNGVNAGTLTVPLTNIGTASLTDLNLIGNEIVFTADGESKKYLGVTGFSVTYSIPEPEEEMPGDIVVEHVKHHVLTADETLSVMTVMEGLTFTFRSENAASMEVVCEDEEANVPEVAKGNEISWSVPVGAYEILVKAYSPSGKKYVEREMIVEGQTVVPATPEFEFNNDAKTLTVMTEAGALEYMVEDYTPSVPAAAPASNIDNTTGWTLGDENEPTWLELSYAELQSPKMLSVRSTTPLTQSDVVRVRVNANGQISGVENVATDAKAAPAEYFDLQGRRVASPANGFYIRMAGGKAEKVVF